MDEKDEDEEISQTIVAKQIVRALSISYEDLDKNLRKIMEGKEKDPDKVSKMYADAQHDIIVIDTFSRLLKKPEKEK
ncbi:MAG: hypothetical protein ACK4YO_02275 [Candidatus Altarchaeaceae archaeon]